MASVQFDGKNAKQKTKAGAHAIILHQSETYRAIMNHSNKDIDPNRTNLNYDMENLTYEEECEKFDKRIEELNPQPNRKGEPPVTYRAVNVVAPTYIDENGQRQYLTEEQEDLFFKTFYERAKNKAGEENVINGHVHRDEIHEYIDAKTAERRRSVAHLAMGFVPATKFKYRKILTDEQKAENKRRKEELTKAGFKWNRKRDGVKVKETKCEWEDHLDNRSFAHIDELKAWNDLADEVCQELFGFSYQTGKEALGQSQDVLKAKSEILAEFEDKTQKSCDAFYESYKTEQKADIDLELAIYEHLEQGKVKRDIGIYEKEQKQLINNAVAAAEKDRQQAERDKLTAQHGLDELRQNEAQVQMTLDSICSALGVEPESIKDPYWYELLQEDVKSLKERADDVDTRESNVAARESAVEARETNITTREKNADDTVRKAKVVIAKTDDIVKEYDEAKGYVEELKQMLNGIDIEPLLQMISDVYDSIDAPEIDELYDFSLKYSPAKQEEKANTYDDVYELETEEDYDAFVYINDYDLQREQAIRQQKDEEEEEDKEHKAAVARALQAAEAPARQSLKERIHEDAERRRNAWDFSK